MTFYFWDKNNFFLGRWPSPLLYTPLGHSCRRLPLNEVLSTPLLTASLSCDVQVYQSGSEPEGRGHPARREWQHEGTEDRDRKGDRREDPRYVNRRRLFQRHHGAQTLFRYICFHATYSSTEI